MRDKITEFMMGRYGVDTLNKHILYLVIALIVLNLFFSNRILYAISYILIAVELFRSLSRNITARNSENKKYEELIAPIQDYFLFRKKEKADPEHKYFRCSNCHAIVRVPKGKGKIEVRCPRCGNTFDARS